MIIGEAIQQELHSQERSVAWFARKLNCNRQNVYDIFKRRTIDTELLMRISKVLNKNFFELYNREFIDWRRADRMK
ncbi:MAG: XRE family transcriptional regulator [Prevotella sp.]|nr:XRE family transcriptional regulator [Prevotella sp.]